MSVVEQQAAKRKSASLIEEIEQEQAGLELSKLETETANKLLVKKVKNFDKKNFYFFDENKNTKNYLADRSKERQLQMRLQKHGMENKLILRKKGKGKNNFVLQGGTAFFHKLTTEHADQRNKTELLVFETQMMHDIHEILNSRDSDEFYYNILSIQRVGPVLIREGFRHLLEDQFRGNISKMAKAFLVLNRIASVDATTDKHLQQTETQKQMNEKGLSFCECSDCWVLNALKLVMLGLRDPLLFMRECLASLRDIEECKKMGRVYDVAIKIAEKRQQKQSKSVVKVDSEIQRQQSSITDQWGRKRMSRILEGNAVARSVREGTRMEFLKTTLAGYFK